MNEEMVSRYNTGKKIAFEHLGVRKGFTGIGIVKHSKKSEMIFKFILT